jgi:hypothetical protein
MRVMSHPPAPLRPSGMNTTTVMIELPADDEEAVRLLERELHEARRRLAETRRRAAFGAYRRLPLLGGATSIR